MTNSTSIPRPSKEELVTNAVKYATELGWFIIPLYPLTERDGYWACTCKKQEQCGRNAGKHPIPLEWTKNSSNDPDTIYSWWDKWPHAGVGLHCGKSGILALDFDSYKPDFAGEQLMTELDATTPTVISGRGGRHLLFRMPDNLMLGNSNSGLPKGIDVKGHNGCLCLPPTLHFCGRQYVWA